MIQESVGRLLQGHKAKMQFKVTAT